MSFTLRAARRRRIFHLDTCVARLKEFSGGTPAPVLVHQDSAGMTEAETTGPCDEPEDRGGAGTARERLFRQLSRGATVTAAAAQAGVDPQLAAVMIEEFERTGLLDRAETLCASGLGACHGGDSPDVRLHCAGCPLIPLGPRK
ncbi:hypothetical protein G7Y41_01385 [Schaalia sp. ZJ405]|uniref:hypothetical protein n=1 Tax=Schaalia sp. ZJ405 TaxID=2709403 RepID=UPI0018CADF2E|nr:hypothetical protein [Schaalia sp. ZJ405]QPK81537.1 hypothetical protein G7Y41_01385 [Schaalia sp. ZJ405]